MNPNVELPTLTAETALVLTRLLGDLTSEQLKQYLEKKSEQVQNMTQIDKRIENIKNEMRDLKMWELDGIIITIFFLAITLILKLLAHFINCRSVFYEMLIYLFFCFDFIWGPNNCRFQKLKQYATHFVVSIRTWNLSLI